MFFGSSAMLRSGVKCSKLCDCCFITIIDDIGVCIVRGEVLLDLRINRRCLWSLRAVGRANFVALAGTKLSKADELLCPSMASLLSPPDLDFD